MGYGIPDPSAWYGIKMIQADQAQHVKGLEEIARDVLFGLRRPDQPVVYGYRRTPAPWPDAVVGVQVDPETVRALRRGDGAVGREVFEAMEEAYGNLMAQARAGKLG